MNDVAEIQTTTDQFILMVERLAANPDMNPENLEKMLDMQERILDRNARMEYNRAMVLAQQEIPKVSKNARGERDLHYANLENIIDVGEPIWSKHGFALSFYEGDSPEGEVRVCCDVTHIGGHVEHRKIDVPLDDKGPKGEVNKTATQGTGSSFSYGRRYLSCGIFNIATGDDRDGAGPVAAALLVPINEAQLKQLDELFAIMPTNSEKKMMEWLATKGFAERREITATQYDAIYKEIKKQVDAYLDSK